MKRKFLSALLATVLMCSTSMTLFACKPEPEPEPEPPVRTSATLTGLYVTGDDDITTFADSAYTVYNHGSTTAATDENNGIAAVTADSSFRVTKEASGQSYQSVFWRVTNWDINKHLQFSVTVKNNLSTPVNVRILLASVDGTGSNLGPTNVHHGDGYASDTNFTLGGGSSRTYRVTQDPDSLYDVVSGEEKALKAVYMRFNTHGTMLGAADVTITKMTLAEVTGAFDIGDFAPLYGSSFHKTLTSQFSESAKTLSSALYMGATNAYSQTNWGFDSQTQAWSASAHRYLHYQLKNVKGDNTNLDTYGVTLLPVKGTGSSASNIGDDVNLGFTAASQTLTGVIDLNDYEGFSTLRLMINDREGNANNVDIPDGIYVAIEAHIMYSDSSTASFGTLPPLSYTVPVMPEPPVITSETGDLTGQVSATAQSIESKVTVTLASQDVVEVDGAETVATAGGVVNKFVVVADYTTTASFNTDLSAYSEFAGVDIDLTEFAERGLLATNGLGVKWKFTNVSGDTIGFASRFISSSTGDQSPGSPRGELAAGESLERDPAIQGNPSYFNLTNFRMYLGTSSATPLSGKVKVEIWFIVSPPSETLAAPVISTDSADSTGRTVKWEAVSKAAGYDVYVGDTKAASKITATSYKLTTTEIGEYNITVKAVGNGSWLKDSAASNAINISVAFGTGATALTAPVISLDSADTNGKTVKWNAVANATGYNVYVNEVMVVENGAAVSYILTESAAGEYDITVKAIGNYTDYKHSVLSNELTITITALPVDTLVGTFSGLHNANAQTELTLTGKTVTLNASQTINFNGGKVLKDTVTGGLTADTKIFRFTVTNNGSTDAGIRVYLKSTAKGGEWSNEATGSNVNGNYGQDFNVPAGQTKTFDATNTTAFIVNIIHFGFGNASDGGASISALDITFGEYGFLAPSSPIGTLAIAAGSEGHFSVDGNKVTCLQSAASSDYKGLTLPLVNYAAGDYTKLTVTLASVTAQGDVQIQFVCVVGGNDASYSGHQAFTGGAGSFEYTLNAGLITDIKLQIVATAGAVFTIQFSLS